MYEVGKDKYKKIFENIDDHAGELETSIALALFPDIVELEKANNGDYRKFRFDALEKGWIKTSRNFSKLNDSRKYPLLSPKTDGSIMYKPDIAVLINLGLNLDLIRFNRIHNKYAKF